MHDSIQILLKKNIENTREKKKELNKQFYLESNFISDIKVNDDIISQYENIIKIWNQNKDFDKNKFSAKITNRCHGKQERLKNIWR